MADPVRGHILVVDSEHAALERTAQTLRACGHTVSAVETSDEAFDAAESTHFDVVLTELQLGGASGLDLCARLLRAHASLPILVLTDSATLATAVDAMRAGAFDYLNKPLDPELLALATARALKHRHLADEVARLREDVATARGYEGILGTSVATRRLLETIARVAPTQATVLIEGESGTGKELVARAIHARSRRPDGPFVAVNCAALPHHLLESELFGHARGAFTDAKVARRGLFLEADGGSLFLDEIGEMPLPTQVKLLRALQERRVRPVGSSTEIPFDARLIVATNRSLLDEVAAKRFREDLYYRIRVVMVHVPALRERRGDVRVLAEAFLARFARDQGRDIRSIAPEALGRLMARTWPGNVRELENAIERAVSMTSADRLRPEDFELDATTRTGRSELSSTVIRPERVEDLLSAADQQHAYLLHVLAMVGGNKSRAAGVLGYDRRTLHRKLRRAEATPSEVPSANDAEPRGRRVRVLIVDGEVQTREEVGALLDSIGHRVIRCATLADAARAPDVDVVLTELSLDDGAGAALVGQRPGTPVIALSRGAPVA